MFFNVYQLSFVPFCLYSDPLSCADTSAYDSTKGKVRANEALSQSTASPIL